MPTTPVHLDTEVIAEVMRLSGTGSPQAAVEAALREYITARRRTQERVASPGREAHSWAPVPPGVQEG